MKALTDTHTLVWALSGQPLGAAARAALAGSHFTASAANLWELVLKSRTPGALLADPLSWWEKYVVASRIPTLAIRIRRDGLTLVTKDAMLARYGAPVVWE